MAGEGSGSIDDTCVDDGMAVGCNIYPSGIAAADVVVELGPGTGGTTRALLRALPQHARLLSIDVNPHFHGLLQRIGEMLAPLNWSVRPQGGSRSA